MSLRGIDGALVDQQRAQLGVAVLLDHEDLVVLGDEVGHLVVEREGAHAQRVEMDAVLLQRRRAPRPSPARSSRNRSTPNRVGCLRGRGGPARGTRLLGGLELAQQPLHVVDVDRPLLAVAGVAVLAGAAGEEGAARRVRAGIGAVGDAVAVDVEVAAEVLAGLEVLVGHHLAAVHPARVVPREAARTASRSCRCRGRACTKIGVCSRSARSKASAANSKHSLGSSGNSSTCLVSPCEA